MKLYPGVEMILFPIGIFLRNTRVSGLVVKNWIRLESKTPRRFTLFDLDEFKKSAGRSKERLRRQCGADGVGMYSPILAVI